ncbi:hypothetical protein Tco_0699913 [Tanacetum coccineum]
MHLGKNLTEHIDEFRKLVGDLATIDIAISDDDQALFLLTSLPSSYGNFVETLLYGRDTLKLEDVLATLNSRELQKMTEAKGDGDEGSKEEEDSGVIYVSGSRADGYDSADVMMAMSVEELLDWIMDSRCSYYITYRRDYLVDFEKYDGDNILLGDDRECRVQGTEGFTVKMQLGKIKVIKGSLVVLSGTRRSNCVYTLDGQAATSNTLKGGKQLGEYQTGWKIKTGNVLDSRNQRSTQQCMMSGVTKHLGVAGIQQQNGLVNKKNVTLFAKVWKSYCWECLVGTLYRLTSLSIAWVRRWSTPYGPIDSMNLLDRFPAPRLGSSNTYVVDFTMLARISLRTSSSRQTRVSFNLSRALFPYTQSSPIIPKDVISRCSVLVTVVAIVDGLKFLNQSKSFAIQTVQIVNFSIGSSVINGSDICSSASVSSRPAAIISAMLKNGNSFKLRVQATKAGDSTTTTLAPATTEEKTQKRNDVKARSTLLMALPNEHQL